MNNQYMNPFMDEVNKGNQMLAEAVDHKNIIFPAIYKHFKNKYYATMGIVKPVEGDIVYELIGKPNIVMFEAKR